MKKAVSAFSAVLLSGCMAVGPEYSAPVFDAPLSFVGGSTETLRQAAEDPWWKNLNDPALNRLVSIGLNQNLDVQTALERIVEAEANARRSGVAQQQLSGDLTASARRSDNGTTISNDTSVSAGATFVFDLFGEFQRGREQSLADLEAANFEAGTVKLAYLSDVVAAYTLVRFFQSAAQITRDTITSRRETLDVALQRAEVQEGTQLEVAQAQSELASAEASLPILTAQAKVNAFRLATLLNVPADNIADLISTGRGIPSPAASAIGVPADLLRNRPDIRSSERDFAAATAAIGVSEAQLYPSLQLLGTVTADDPNTWSFGPTLSLPLLDRGLRRANREIAESRARQAELAYRQVFVSSIEEVQSAQVLTQARKAQVAAFTKAASSSERVLNLARRSYEAGVATIETVNDAERARLRDRLNLAQAQSDYAQAWVGQEVAVGKGWAVTPDTALAMLKNSPE